MRAKLGKDVDERRLVAAHLACDLLAEANSSMRVDSPLDSLSAAPNEGCKQDRGTTHAESVNPWTTGRRAVRRQDGLADPIETSVMSSLLKNASPRAPFIDAYGMWPSPARPAGVRRPQLGRG